MSIKMYSIKFLKLVTFNLGGLRKGHLSGRKSLSEQTEKMIQKIGDYARRKLPKETGCPQDLPSYSVTDTHLIERNGTCLFLESGR